MVYVNTYGVTRGSGARSHLLFLDQCPCVSRPASPCSPPNPLDVFSEVDGDVVTHDVRDVTDVDPAGDEIRADESSESKTHNVRQLNAGQIWADGHTYI